MNQKRKCLNGSMYGEKIMVISPLLKWYVKLGLKVTQIHQVVEYSDLQIAAIGKRKEEQ